MLNSWYIVIIKKILIIVFLFYWLSRLLRYMYILLEHVLVYVLVLLLLWQYVFYMLSPVTCLTRVSFVICHCGSTTKLVSPLEINKVFNCAVKFYINLCKICSFPLLHLSQNKKTAFNLWFCPFCPHPVILHQRAVL